MEFLNASHPFYGASNIEALLKMIEQRVLEETGETIVFQANEQMTQEMYQAARDYNNYMITSDVNEGLAKLNDVVVRRALRALTTVEEAGQYIPQNQLYKQTRDLRGADDGLQDPRRHGSSVTLGNGKVFKQRHLSFQTAQRQRQNEYMNHPYTDKFLRARPVMHKDAEFRDL
jgi:hypothetical protein